MTESTDIQSFAESTHTQMRKGVLVYCVLVLCSHGKVYTSDIIKKLHQAELIVVEGTLYPLLNRLAKDGILAYEWQESEQGPPRKYYWLTTDGEAALAELAQVYSKLHSSINSLKKGAL